MTTPSVRDRVHELKTWPGPFQAMALGLKPFEIRRDDRGYRVSDLLVLREWDPEAGQADVDAGYTGRSIRARVTYVLHGDGGGDPTGQGAELDSWCFEMALDEGWVALGLNVFTITGKRTTVGTISQGSTFAVPQVLVEGEPA